MRSGFAAILLASILMNILLHAFQSAMALDAAASNNFFVLQRRQQPQQKEQPLLGERNIPEQLMNPVVRSQIRQRLLKLKMQKDSLLRQQTEQNGGSGGSSLASSSSSSGELLAGQLPFNNRNCFFSPVNCHLPVVGLRHTMKRQPAGVPFVYYQFSPNEQQQFNQMLERRIAQFLMAASTANRQ